MTAPAVHLSPDPTPPAARPLCLIAVTHNSAGDILRMLESLPLAGLEAGDEVIVVDNASQDETVEVVASSGRARLIATGTNLGYSGAINRAREERRGGGDVVVVNPDLRLEAGSLTELRSALGDARVGIAVPRMVDERGHLFHSLRREPTVRRALGDAVLGRRWPRRPSWLSEVVWDDRAYARPHDVDWATGAAMLIREECDAVVGDWDADCFFLYSEETDYARRARDSGFCVRYVPTAVVMHRGSGSGASYDLMALLAVNRVRYFEKHHRRAHALAFHVVATLHELLRAHRPGSRRALRCLLSRRACSSLPGARG